MDPREQRAAQTAEIPAGERLKEGGTAELRHTRYLISLVSLWAGKKLTTSIKAEVHSQTWMYYVEASSNLCLLDNHLCLTIFCPTVHQIGSDSEVLRLYQVWSLHHRFSWEGLSRYSRCWQQRAQLSRQIAQWSDERGQLQSHTHEMLAGHLIRKFDRKKKKFFYNNADIIAILHSKRSIVDVRSKQAAYDGQHRNFFLTNMSKICMGNFLATCETPDEMDSFWNYLIFLNNGKCNHAFSKSY